MKLETNMAKFRGFSNPLTKEGMRALVIVLGAILVISTVVYSPNFDKRRGSTVLPSKTLVEVTATPTVAPLIEEATSSASPTPTVEEVTATPAPTR